MVVLCRVGNARYLTRWRLRRCPEYFLDYSEAICREKLTLMVIPAILRPYQTELSE